MKRSTVKQGSLKAGVVLHTESAPHLHKRRLVLLQVFHPKKQPCMFFVFSHGTAHSFLPVSSGIATDDVLLFVNDIQVSFSELLDRRLCSSGVIINESVPSIPSSGMSCRSCDFLAHSRSVLFQTCGINRSIWRAKRMTLGGWGNYFSYWGGGLMVT